MGRYAIGDIHGCLKTFKALLEKLEFTTDDELYLLGDYINKGPDSKGVLDHIMEMIDSGYNIRAVRGNHDERLINIQLASYPGNWTKEQQNLITLKSFGIDTPFEVDHKYLKFLEGLPYFIETPDYLMVHAGLDFSIQNPFMDKIGIMNIKNYQVDQDKIGGRKIIHGHVPQQMDAIKTSIKTKSPKIGIDGGCVYYKNEDLGNLVALNLDTLEIITQKNVEGSYEINRK